MVALLSTFQTLALFTSLAVAAPASHLAHRESHASTHHVRSLPNGIAMRSYHAPSTFEVYGRGIDHSLSKRAGASLRDIGMTFIKEKTSASFAAGTSGVDSEAVWQSTIAREATTSHVYAFQQVNGIPVAGTVANAALTGGKVTTYTSNFVKPSSVASKEPKLSSQAAISAASKFLSGTATGNSTTLKYYALEDNTLALTHATDLKLSNQHLVRAFVDAETGDVRGLVDYTTNLAFRVSPLTSQDPSKDFELLTDPENLKASPQGWTNFDGQETNATAGNNAIAFIGDPNQGVGAQSAAGVFDFTPNFAQDPTQGENQNAAVTNAFFVTNTVHDIFYVYGFDEGAFNFQEDNLGNGGQAGDPVLVSVQDASGTDNAQFTSPADGQSGVMQMFLFTNSNPEKDGALVNSVVAHEMVHGVSNRLTGGGTGDCLQTLESGGLGEGWSDAFADWALNSASGQVDDVAIGDFLFAGGIRNFPYSLDRQVNPLKFSDVAKLDEVHNIGEVWAQTLHVVNAALVEAKGFSNDSFTNPEGTGGNTAWLHLFTDGLSIQPCNPTFLDARAAWIQADVNRFNGDNACTLWTAFASMGLGPDASEGVDDNNVPASCGGTGGEVASTGTGNGNGGAASGAGGAGTTTGNGGTGRPRGRGRGRGGRGRNANAGFAAHQHI